MKKGLRGQKTLSVVNLTEMQVRFGALHLVNTGEIAG